MNKVLDAESPQLVVLNGDLITGTNTYLLNSSAKIDQMVAPLVEHNLTWASTYGNHDSAFNLSRLNILARERRYPNARTSQMVFGADCGVSNYYLPVYPTNCTTSACTPTLFLWFFDSRGGEKFQQLTAKGSTISQPDWVHPSVVDWFTETKTQLTTQYGKSIPSLAFVHIPTNASRALQTELGVDPNRQPGINNDNILSGQAQGWYTEGSNQACTYGGQDVPFMQAIASTPGLTALFSGHDHGDSWCYRWAGLLPGMTVNGSGVNICFGQHSGYGGYGTWIRGSRQVLVTEEMLRDLAVETWIRLEDGRVVGAVTLNQTYGVDVYPVTSDMRTSCEGCDYSVVSSMPGTG
jgi:hypothetical protein